MSFPSSYYSWRRKGIDTESLCILNLDVMRSLYQIQWAGPMHMHVCLGPPQKQPTSRDCLSEGRTRQALSAAYATCMFKKHPPTWKSWDACRLGSCGVHWWRRSVFAHIDNPPELMGPCRASKRRLLRYAVGQHIIMAIWSEARGHDPLVSWTSHSTVPVIVKGRKH